MQFASFIIRIFTFCCLVSLVQSLAFAQGQLSTEKTVYRGSNDTMVTVKKVAVIPLTDNSKGVYSRPIEDFLIETINRDHQWDLEKVTAIGALPSPEELERNPGKVKEVSRSMKGDAFLTGRIIKLPSGITLKLNLFLTSDNKLYAQEIIKDYDRFEIGAIKTQVGELLKKIKARLPYDGLVLSRHGQRVTVNVGKKNGIKPNKVISVIQVIKLNRHPKFNFVINSEKEVIGKIRLLKVDNTLSFGKIISEIEKGAIQKEAKISGLKYAEYTDSSSLVDAKSDADALLGRADGKVAFGDRAQSWRPKKPPTFGQVGASFGLGIFKGAQSFNAESLSAKDPYYPSVQIEAELWLTKYWSMHAKIRQGIITTDNPVDGGDPSSLNYALGAHELLAGYNIRLGPTAWGPKLEILAGFATYKLSVDDTDGNSTTDEITTLKYSGFKFGAAGQFPITPDQKWSMGAALHFVLNPKLSESPQSSGSSSNTINNFGIFVNQKFHTHLYAKYGMDYELYSTKFSGSGGSSSSRKHTTLSAGLYYMF